MEGAAANRLILDTRDLNIEKIEGESGNGQWQPLKYELAARDPLLGNKLTIQAPERNGKVRVTYRTSPQASGLQWLDAGDDGGQEDCPSCSASRRRSTRARGCRCRTRPRVRFTYTAHVTTRRT